MGDYRFLPKFYNVFTSFCLERFPKSVKRFSDKKRGVNNGLERRSDPIRSKCALIA